MTRRFSPADAAACAAAGVGAWFTRASLDVFDGPGGDARVAMLPAPIELVGLVALACLSAFLLRIILSRSPHVGTSAAGTGNAVLYLLVPLISVLAIAVPYAPWLADAVPAWRALAGPARFALWALVCGQVVWIGIDALKQAAAPSRGTSARQGAAWDDSRPARYAYRRVVRDYGPALAVLLASFVAGAIVTRRLVPDVFGGDGAVDAGLSIGLRLFLGAIVSALVFLGAERAAGSRAAGATAWLAMAAAAPFLISGILSPTAYAAAACVVLAAGWPAGGGDSPVWAAAVRGSVLAALAWLDVTYVPLAIVLAGCLVWRMRHARGTIIGAAAPVLVGVLARLAFAGEGWHALAASHEAIWWSAAAVLAGQQDGVLFYAPAVVLAIPGLWWLWRDGGGARVTAVEAVGGTAAMLLTAGWQGDATRALAIPGAHLMPALPLLVPAIARWLRHAAAALPHLAVARLLVLWGVIASASLVLARGGTALVRGRDGASGLLEWLAPSRDLVRLAPIGPSAGGDPFAFVVSTLIWIAVAAGLGWVISRTRPTTHGGAALLVTIGALAALGVGAAAVEATLGGRLPARLAPRLRTEVRMLDNFDARRRPLAIAYDGWRTLPAADVPPLFSFDATPGARRYPQPLRVLLNTRLALPAGEYVVTLHPKPGGALTGDAGLQVGRMGPPMRQWLVAAAPGERWTAAFTLPVDASFVGLRATPQFESTVAELRIQPARVVNGRDRRALPPVLSAATYSGVIVTFHGDQVYAERDGFWVRGRSTLLATFAPPEGPERQPGVKLSLHGGAAPTRVRFETTTWGTTVALEPGVSREVRVPALQGQSLLPVRITPESGFVPAQAEGSSDRRLLGCWIEVLE